MKMYFKVLLVTTVAGMAVTALPALSRADDNGRVTTLPYSRDAQEKINDARILHAQRVTSGLTRAGTYDSPIRESGGFTNEIGTVDTVGDGMEKKSGSAYARAKSMSKKTTATTAQDIALNGKDDTSTETGSNREKTPSINRQSRSDLLYGLKKPARLFGNVDQ